MKHDPSLTSHYVGNEFYEKLITDFTGWRREELERDDPALRDSCRRVLEREARLLEELRLEDWLALYAPECLYWVPATPEGGDPRREVAIAFDDRRRLEDRIYRLRLAHAWSQRPPSRTVRLVSNVEVFATDAEDLFMVRSTFMISEFWAEEVRHWAGWCGHRLRQKEDGWDILVKQVNLIDCDRNIRNPSIIL
ncbi:MAG: aromatic-ring-hydroxylating dioxygenase subunit beta [Hyphomicrobiales bacterium]|nr:aromatic-ring-hydroxylating dioxygenase subunit beta [Hyphomicrobiales bacterium]